MYIHFLFQLQKVLAFISHIFKLYTENQMSISLTVLKIHSNLYRNHGTKNEVFHQDFFSKCEENLNRKLHFLCSEFYPQCLYSSRSSHQRCSTKKGVLKNLTKFTGKYLRQSCSFNEVLGLWSVTLLKKKLRHKFFPVSFTDFLGTTFLQNTSQRLLLQQIFCGISFNKLQFFKLSLISLRTVLLGMIYQAYHFKCSVMYLKTDFFDKL